MWGRRNWTRFTDRQIELDLLWYLSLSGVYIHFVESATPATACSILIHKIHIPIFIHFEWVTTTVRATPTLSSTMAALRQFVLCVGGGARDNRQQTTDNRESVRDVRYSKSLMKCNHLENPANTFIVIASCSRATGLCGRRGESPSRGGAWALVGVLTGIWSTYAATLKALLSAFLTICSFDFARSSNLYRRFAGHTEHISHFILISVSKSLHSLQF